MITVTKKDLIELGYGTSFAADIIREAKRLMILSQNAGPINEGELDILVLYTGTINTGMVKMILKKNKFELRKCEI